MHIQRQSRLLALVSPRVSRTQILVINRVRRALLQLDAMGCHVRVLLLLRQHKIVRSFTKHLSVCTAALETEDAYTGRIWSASPSRV